MNDSNPGVSDIEQPPEPPVAGVPSDNTTLTAVLAALDREGYATQLLHDEDGNVSCTACGSRTAATTLVVEHSRRLEGASDPDDMSRVVATRCPACGAGGTLVLGFGVNASSADLAVANALQEPRTDENS